MNGLDTSVLTRSDSEEPKLQLTVRLPSPVMQRVEFEAERTGLSLAEVVRRYLEKGMEEDWNGC